MDTPELTPNLTPNLTPADALLLKHAHPTYSDSVLIWGVGNGALPTAIAERGNPARTMAVDRSVVTLAEAARHSPAIAFVRPIFLSTVELRNKVPPAFFTLALVNIGYAASSEAVAADLARIGTLLRPGGTVYVVGAKNKGIDSAGKELERIFGAAQLVEFKKGQRLYVATRTDGYIPPELSPELEQEVEIRGQRFILRERAGVFARGLLDPATAMLADAMLVRAADSVLDMGGGSGILGMVAARLSDVGDVFITDADIEAVELARLNIERNGIRNITVLAGDGAFPVRYRQFDVVVTNPPFHAGRNQDTGLAVRFIDHATTVLRSDGIFYLVANRFLKYEPKLGEYFRETREIAGDGKFKVLEMRGPKRGLSYTSSLRRCYNSVGANNGSPCLNL